LILGRWHVGQGGGNSQRFLLLGVAKPYVRPILLSMETDSLSFAKFFPRPRKVARKVTCPKPPKAKTAKTLASKASKPNA